MIGGAEPAAAPPDESPPGLSAVALEEIDAILSSFRIWLIDMERLARSRRGEEAAPEESGELVDVHTLLSEMIALRKEVQIESRASKSSRERLDETSEALAGGIRHLQAELREELGSRLGKLEELLGSQRRREELERAETEAIQTLLDVREGLDRGRRAALAARDRLGWRRAFLPGELFAGIVEGYEMGLRGIDRRIEEHGVERLSCLGKPFDPTSMKAVEIEEGGAGDGTVLEEIRHGFRHRGRVIRYAEVRVAAPSRVEPGGLEETGGGAL